MSTRPKLELEHTVTDKAFEWVGWLTLMLMWLMAFVQYTKLPDTIPIHYDAKGLADGFGENSGILTLPFIATCLFAGLTYLNKFPHIFNYTTTITAENASDQYHASTRTLRYLKLIIVVVFGFIEFKTIQVATGQAEGLGKWFLPLILLLMSLPTVYFISRMLLANKN